MLFLYTALKLHLNFNKNFVEFWLVVSVGKIAHMILKRVGIDNLSRFSTFQFKNVLFGPRLEVAIRHTNN